jgi:hypothetical protein
MAVESHLAVDIDVFMHHETVPVVDKATETHHPLSVSHVRCIPILFTEITFHDSVNSHVSPCE